MLSFSLRIAVEAGQQPPVVQLLLQRVVVSALPHLPEHRDDPDQDDGVERRDQEQEEPGHAGADDVGGVLQVRAGDP